MLTNKKLVYSDSASKTKNKVLEKISLLAKENGKATDSDELLKAFKEREKEFSTGIGDGIAIPHAAIKGAKDAAVIVSKVKDVEWDAIDEKPVKIVIAIIVPKDGRGEHLTILSHLSKMLLDSKVQETLLSGSIDEVVELVNSAANFKEDAAESKVGDKYIIGITACPSGVAHTFLAQQSIIDEAKKRGFKYKVETQGSEGPKNALTIQDIEEADGIIISTAIKLSGMERFNGYEAKINHVGLQPVIKDAASAVDKALEIGKQFGKGPSSNGLQSNTTQSSSMFAIEGEGKIKVFMNHLMTGLGAMIPLLIVAGIFMAIGSLGALPWYANVASEGASAFDADWVFGLGKWAAQGPQNAWVQLCYYSAKFGGYLMGFMYPVLAMFMARSIAGKQGTIPGFVAGLMAAGGFQGGVSQEIFTNGFLAFLYPSGEFVASSIFGAIIMGGFAGWFVKYLNEKIQVSFNLLSVKTLLILPVVSSLAVFTGMMLIINPVFGLFNWGIQEVFSATGESGRAVYWWLMAASIASDLGGPINKAAGAVAISMNTDALAAYQAAVSSGASAEVMADVTEQIKTFNLTARNIAVVVPSIGLGTAALFSNKITGRTLFTRDEASIGSQSIFLALCGISEGAIPFLMKYPVYVLIADVVGSMVGVTVAMFVATPIQTFPMSESWGWPLIGSTTLGGEFAPIWAQITSYITSIAIGAGTTAVIITAFLLSKDIKEDFQNPVSKISKLKENGSIEQIDRTVSSLVTIDGLLNDEFDYLGTTAKAKSNEYVFNTNEKITLSKMKVKINKAKSEISKHEFAIRQLNMELTNNEATFNDLTTAQKDTSKIKLKLKKIEDRINYHTRSLEESKVAFITFLSDEKQRIKDYSTTVSSMK